jgi:hypothetical protein
MGERDSYILYRFDKYNNRLETHKLSKKGYDEPYPCNNAGLYKAENKNDFMGNFTVYGWKSIKKAKTEQIEWLKEEIAKRKKQLSELNKYVY